MNIANMMVIGFLSTHISVNHKVVSLRVWKFLVSVAKVMLLSFQELRWPIYQKVGINRERD